MMPAILAEAGPGRKPATKPLRRGLGCDSVAGMPDVPSGARLACAP